MKNATRILHGAPVAARIDAATLVAAQKFCQKKGRQPSLAIVHFGDNPDDASYRYEIIKQAELTHIDVREIDQLPDSVSASEVRRVLLRLHRDKNVDGVLVQTVRDKALRHAVALHLSNAIDPEGVTMEHMGALFFGEMAVPPCTPYAILTLIKEYYPDVRGKDVVIVNSSPVIGRPLAILLLQEGATPIICGKDTKNLPKKAREADIIVTATGVHGLIGPQHVTRKSVVIDASIIRRDGHIIGDVLYDEIKNKVAAITPVPGGVGPVTTATLLSNVVKLATK